MEIRNLKLHKGFTMVELLVIMAIIAIVLGLTTVNLLPLQNRSQLSSTVATALTDIKQQQIKAMIGDTDGGTSREPYGVYFQPNSYTVYPGTSFSATNDKNFSVTLDAPLSVSDTFTDHTMTFASGSGELVNFDPTHNTVTFSVSATGEQKIVTFNKYGNVISVE